MGRLGRLPIEMPDNVKAKVEGLNLEISGPKGTLGRKLSRKVILKEQDGTLVIEKKGDSKEANTMQGTTRAHVSNMVKGVTEGWKRELEISGPGYRAEAKPGEIVLNVGYSHPVIIKAPENISFSVEKSTITVEGIDKEKVGHIAALIRGSRKPNPYTGSGVKYSDEIVRRKAGKQAGAAE